MCVFMHICVYVFWLVFKQVGYIKNNCQRGGNIVRIVLEKVIFL